MEDKRNNCIILLADAPEPEKTNSVLRTSLGEDRALHVSDDLIKNSHALAKNFKNAILLISYEKTQFHPDLTWLDPEDPGFLETTKKTSAERLIDAFNLAFNAGAKKALFLNHLSPAVKPEWLSQAFDAAEEKTISVGRNKDGSFYLLALTQNNFKIISDISPDARIPRMNWRKKQKRTNWPFSTRLKLSPLKTKKRSSPGLRPKPRNRRIFRLYSRPLNRELF